MQENDKTLVFGYELQAFAELSPVAALGGIDCPSACIVRELALSDDIQS